MPVAYGKQMVVMAFGRCLFGKPPTYNHESTGACMIRAQRLVSQCEQLGPGNPTAVNP
jgi:hypothetical protein